MVPGHEIAGIVTAVGSEVTKYKVGDRVGVGCFVDSCRECEQCRAGEEQYCTNRGWSAPTTASAATASRPRAATAARSSSTRTTCCASPIAAVGRRRAAAVRGHHAVFASAPLECRARHARRGHRPRWPGPHGRQARGGDGRRGDGAEPIAEENGGRPSARRRPSTTRPPTRRRSPSSAARSISSSTPCRPTWTERLPEPARRRRHPGRAGHARAPDDGPGVPLRRCGAAWPAR